uniref:Uncharacterized protein n=1 Tax=Oryza punctata TaxID=4537 RepID=A0A0E0LTH8_ORYPU
MLCGHEDTGRVVRFIIITDVRPLLFFLFPFPSTFFNLQRHLPLLSLPLIPLAAGPGRPTPKTVPHLGPAILLRVRPRPSRPLPPRHRPTRPLTKPTPLSPANPTSRAA